MKKFLSLLVCTVLLTGCAQSKQPSNELTIWHWMTDRDQAFQVLAQKYEAKTGVKVRIELFTPPDTFNQRIIASTQANKLPDIYGILDKKEAFADYIRYGYIANLTEEFKKDDAAWESSFFEKAVDVNRFTDDNIYKVKPGIYGVPIDVTSIQMLYNKKLLAKAGIKEAPQTFDDFLEAMAALNRVGVNGLVSGWGELWMVDAFASNYAFNIMGEDKVMATYRGDVPYTDPDWIKVFNVFAQLRDAGGLVRGIVTKPNKEAEQDFALERAAFAYNGSWCVNVYHEMNKNLDYSAMLPPAVSSGYPMKIWGGAGSSFVVSAHSPNKDKAIAFLKWLTAKDQQVFLAHETRNLPSNREALNEIPEILSEFARVMEDTTHPTIWKYNELINVSQRFDRGIQSIIIGEKTPEQVAEEVQHIKRREMQKAAQRR